jgi:hypothetical protein
MGNRSPYCARNTSYPGHRDQPSHDPDSGCVRHSYGSHIWGNTPEFSIGQGVIDTPTESELGEYGNRRLENARIRGVVNLVSAGVWGGFYRRERGVGIEANGKLVR